MNNHKALASQLKKWGRKITVVDGAAMRTQSANCFIQALRYKNKMYLEGTPTAIGISDAGYYLLLGPPDLDLSAVANGGYITDGEKKFHVDKWEKVYADTEIFYTWAVIKEDVEGCYPDYDHFRRRGE